MVTLKHTAYLADYNCSSYGAGSYGTCNGGGLADTGFDVLLPVFLGVSLVAASLVLVVRRVLRRRKAAAQADV